MSIVMSLLGLVSVPILACLAWCGWARTLRKELPPWRNALSFSALLLLSIVWVAVALLEGPVFVRPQVHRPEVFMEAMLTLSVPLFVLVLALGLALRGVPRVLTMLAALLMLISWPVGYVQSL
jgi:hypothetical protein